jgi:hypothetical protein
MRSERDPQQGQMPKETADATVILTPSSVISELKTKKPGGTAGRG